MSKSFNLKESDFAKNLTHSIKDWMEHNFFQDGGYFFHSGVLTQGNHPSYSSSQVFQSNNKNWVWESGSVDIFVNNIPASGYEINYRDGLVIFNTQPSGVVSASYNYKFLDINRFEDDVDKSSYNPIDIHSLVFKDKILSLPGIIIELGGSNSSPYELGSFSRDIYQTILVNIYAKKGDIVNKIGKVLEKQVDSYVKLYNYEQSYSSGYYSIGLDGTLNNQLATYNNLCDIYPDTNVSNSEVFIKNSEFEKKQKLENNLYHGTVRFEILATSKML